MKRAFATIAIIIAAVLVIGLAFEFGYARISSSDYSGSSETFAYSCQYGAECPLTTGTYTYSFNGTIHTITAHSETEQENETFDHNWAMINFTVDRENENFPIVITPCYEHVPTNLTANAAPQASLGCHNAPTHPINITGIFSNVTIAYIADNESILQVELAQRGSVAMVIQSSVDPERVLADGIPISSWTYSKTNHRAAWRRTKPRIRRPVSVWGRFLTLDYLS